LICADSIGSCFSPLNPSDPSIGWPPLRFTDQKYSPPAPEPPAGVLAGQRPLQRRRGLSARVGVSHARKKGSLLRQRERERESVCKAIIYPAAAPDSSHGQPARTNTRVYVRYEECAESSPFNSDDTHPHPHTCHAHTPAALPPPPSASDGSGAGPNSLRV